MDPHEIYIDISWIKYFDLVTKKERCIHMNNSWIHVVHVKYVDSMWMWRNCFCRE